MIDHFITRKKGNAESVTEYINEVAVQWLYCTAFPEYK